MQTGKITALYVRFSFDDGIDTESGSIEQNGKTTAEQIGGQIFIDTWGLVSPGNPEQAAHYAKIAASVTHDGNRHKF